MGSRRLVGDSAGAMTLIDDRTREDVAAEMKMTFDTMIEDGMPYAGKVLQIDEESIGRMTTVAASIGAGVALPAGFAWRMKDNSSVAMDETAFLAMATAAFDYVNALRVRMWTAIDAARSAATDAAARAVVF